MSRHQCQHWEDYAKAVIIFVGCLKKHPKGSVIVDYEELNQTQDGETSKLEFSDHHYEFQE